MYRGGKNELDPARIWGDDGLPDPGSTIARAGEAKSLSEGVNELTARRFQRIWKLSTSFWPAPRRLQPRYTGRVEAWSGDQFQ